MVKVVFSNDGTRMFTLGKSNNRIYAYNLSTAWSISTATLSTSYTIGSNLWTDMIFSSTGKYIFISTSTGSIYRITLATEWDLATVSSMDLNLSLANTYTSGGDFNIKAMHISPYGDKLFIAGGDKMLVQSYTIT
jgi:WD40 repeat protein